MADQEGWRWCRRCQVLAYSGFGNGVCFDEEPHDFAGSGPYRVDVNDDEDLRIDGFQDAWRWCLRCQGMAFSGNSAGNCYDGSAHDFEGSVDYLLPLEQIPAGAQSDWRWCWRCQLLFYAGFGDGICWDGGQHDGGQSGAYAVRLTNLAHPPPPPPPPPPRLTLQVSEQFGEISVHGEGFTADRRVLLSFVRSGDVKKYDLVATSSGAIDHLVRALDPERVGGAVIASDLSTGNFTAARTSHSFPLFRPIDLAGPDGIPV